MSEVDDHSAAPRADRSPSLQPLTRTDSAVSPSDGAVLLKRVRQMVDIELTNGAVMIPRQGISIGRGSLQVVEVDSQTVPSEKHQLESQSQAGQVLTAAEDPSRCDTDVGLVEVDGIGDVDFELFVLDVFLEDDVDELDGEFGQELEEGLAFVVQVAEAL